MADDTYEAARRRAASALASSSGPEAALDARILLEAASGLDRAGLLREGSARLDAAVADRFAAMLERRRSGEPVWRILGKREFWGLPFTITPAVLDPRPDTETLVSEALAVVEARREAPLRILDLGTGSGAILCALLSEWPAALGWGVDRSERACRVAQGNVEALGFASRALVVNGAWSAAMPDAGFDVVVSNPPYIPSATIPELAPEVRKFDPHQALDGGPDGLACYRAIVPNLPRLLAPGGVSVLEVGAGQVQAVAQLLSEAGLILRATHRDLGGHERAVVAANSS